ncbi:MAG: hypothetical protein J1E35_10520 [Lachnospiraceae bacterium]|nr:hypothetical protein [Lachnospiraceae bacterium]
MGAVLFLIIGTVFGYAVCETLFPNLKRAGEKTFDGREISLSSYFLRVPAWVLAGLIPLTWAVYFTAYALKVYGGKEYPLFLANVLMFLLFVIVSAVLLFFLYRKGKQAEGIAPAKSRLTVGEWIFLAVLAVLIIQIMFLTFFVSDGKLYVGLSVFSDFAPHMGMIRSFSYGNNFPTSYSHFAGEDIRYHFLFQFLAGNLEFLGMRLDFAFNLPSIFGLFASCVLLYALAVKLTGKRLVGYLTTLFFLFRSSPSFFRFLAEIPKGHIVERLATQVEFISYTQNEGWGLWNLNVYCNQRHFAFAIAVMLLALHYFMPYVYAMAEKLNKVREEFSRKGSFVPAFGRFLTYGKTLFFSRSAFGVKRPLVSLFLGILLGGLAFFNGSVLTAACALLFFMAAVSEYRLDYLITAATALILSLLESALFVNGSAVSPSYFFGFLADNKTLFGAADYMWQLWGILLFFTAGYLLFGRGVKRYLVIVFSVPLVMAFTVSLTVDVTVNHKFVMLSEMLLSLFPAIVVGELFSKRCAFLENRLAIRRAAAVLLTVILTATGFFEYLIVQRRNQPQNNLVYDLKDPLTLWLKENADSDDVILSSWYHLHRVVLGGGMLYYGWPYYAWSAGYDTDYRERQVARMFEAETVQELDALIRANGIRYIIVDNEARRNTGYVVREDVIDTAYEAVYTEGEEEWKLTVYDTKKPVFKNLREENGN